jgi:hypothetical protein
MTTTKKNDRLVRMQKFMGGLETYCKQKTLVINGAPVKCDALVQKIQGQYDQLRQVVTTREAYQLAVATAKQIASSFDATFSQVRAYAAAQFGVGSEAYLALGFAPPKPRQRSAQSIAQAVQQNLATRKARNTMGRKQRLAIRGVVPAASSQPVASSQPATAPVTPANGTTSTSSSPNGTGTQSH